MKYLEIKEIGRTLSGEGEFPGIAESLSYLDCLAEQ